MDLRALKADGVATMEIEDNAGTVIMQDRPADAPADYVEKPVTITFKGIDSPEFIRKRDEVADFRRKRGVSGVTQAQLESDTIEMIVAVTSGWDGVQLDGQVLEFNLANVRRVYREVPVVLEQANRFLASRQFFTKAASKSS
jgi:hypothetical protein